MTAATIGWAQTIGMRETQEDCAVIWPGGASFEPELDWPAPSEGEQLLVLADGMGGHAAGDLAARLACEAFVAAYADLSDPPTAIARVGARTGGARSQVRSRPFLCVTERLKEAIEAANDAVAVGAAESARRAGMGTTLVGAVLSDAGLEWISVGDSPLLLVRDREIAMLNEDHSLAPALDRLVAEGRMSEETARLDPRRHMLRSAVTGDTMELIDLSKSALSLVAGDVVICASDGLDTLEDGEIVRIASAYRGDGAQAVADALVRAVDAARDPMQDNTTIIVATC